ncbi:MAG: toll/interleukin-1 receptor domain-containing protein [Anaerolineaceae bacterium]|nr:toll/interleukin-1 receptor domain-containing protein [Anaerolineaceae bacterium]MCB9099378.1 toll/interleukin-1 receptor domain-containing protein [Anaerolineales bacterium]
MAYNSAEIRKLLQNALGEDEFMSLCYDYFRPVYDQFSAGMGRLQKTQRLLEYCERQDKFDELLAHVREINPGQVDKFVGAIGGPVKQAAVQTTPSTVRQDYQNPPQMNMGTVDVDHIKSLLDIKQRRLKVLEKQQAAMADLTPPHIVVEIETLQDEIKQFQAQLGQPSSFTKSPSADPVVQSKGSTPDSDIQPDKEIFVSYAWGGDSEVIVNQLDQAFKDKGITIIRDKRDLGYRGSIKEFMGKIGRGKAVVVVISKKYLESENCMFELIQIAENDQFYDRIFPIVLSDANIYKPVQRIHYVKYWEDQVKELDEAIKSVGSANLEGIRDDIDLYTKIRAAIAGLTNTLKDMNTLTPDMHRDANFEQLIKAVERKMTE